MTAHLQRIDSFDLKPGRIIAAKYVVDQRLGGGWEGEVYKVIEETTGAHRAMKIFFPHRNENDRSVTHYARKLERLRQCPIVIHYHHSERIRYRGHPVTCLVSEYVDGALLSDFVAASPGHRLPAFEALHLLHAITVGVEQIHREREYHGDLHAGNVLVRRQGITFDVKVVDFFYWGRSNATHRWDDVADIIRLLYDAVGGRKMYAQQPAAIKQICLGLRRDLLRKRFPTATRLRQHLETFEW